ncbi:MAG: hypothetical protein LBG29_01600 [Synergistaceae bacterium]|jgi:hypothetical protein|nr:hypothetical protein [Synergistaceae bacterium]
MRILKFFAAALFTILTFLIGAWLFAPWESGGLYAFDKARVAAAEKGWFLSYSGFESDGTVFPSYRIRSLDIESQFLKTSLADVTVKVLPLSSVLAGAPVGYVEFTGGGTSLYLMESVLQNVFSHGGGRLWLTVSRKKLKVANAFIGGDLQVTGNLDFDRNKGIFAQNTMLIKVPANIDVMMNSVGSQYVGRYLEAGSPGEWRIKDNALSY